MIRHATLDILQKAHIFLIIIVINYCAYVSFRLVFGMK